MTDEALQRYLFDLWIAWRYNDISDAEASWKWEPAFEEYTRRGCVLPFDPFDHENH